MPDTSSEPYNAAVVRSLYLDLCQVVTDERLDVDSLEFEAIVNDLLDAEARQNMPAVRCVVADFDAWRRRPTPDGRVEGAGVTPGASPRDDRDRNEVRRPTQPRGSEREVRRRGGRR